MEDQSSVDDIPEEYAREAEDVLKALRVSDIARTRSMSPSRIHPRLARRQGIQSEILPSTEKSTEPRHLEDLPTLELEGAPAGWGNSRRTRSSMSNNSSSTMLPGNRRNSAFPTPTNMKLEDRRSSAAGRRRASQMTHDEWCQLKRLQEIHDSSTKERRESAVDLEHLKNMKKNISFDEWSKITEERKKRETSEIEQMKAKEEKDKQALDMAKYKRRMSYDQWMENKEIMGERDRKLSDTKPVKNEIDEEKKKKSEEAHRKWVLKKELEQLGKDRKSMLRRPSGTAGELSTV